MSKNEGKCCECKYEYLSKEEHPCSVCRWRFKDRKLVVLGKINYFEPKEDTEFENPSTKDDKTNMVNHPSHYQHGIEPIDYIESHDLNFNLGNVIKYVSRAPFKGTELEDLKKAKWYLEREIKKHDR